MFIYKLYLVDGRRSTKTILNYSKNYCEYRNLDLSVGVYFTSESKNLKDLESFTNVLKNDNNKEDYEKFNNLKAANFWIYSFGRNDHIPFKTFINKFKILFISLK